MNVFTGGSFGVEDIFNLETSDNGLPPRFRPRGSYLGNKAVFNAIRMMSVGTVGQGSVWVPGIAGDRPPTLNGYNAYEDSGMDANLAAGNDILVLGDFNYFLIADRIGLTIEVVPHVFGPNQRPTNQRGVYAYWMNNTLILSDNAFRKLRTGTGS
jgi:HK97 family phage major capsid protein